MEAEGRHVGRGMDGTIEASWVRYSEGRGEGMNDGMMNDEDGSGEC